MRSVVLAAGLLLLVSGAAPARAADLPASVADLEKDGAEWFRKAGDRATPLGDRNECRKKSWAALRPAREALERHWESNPLDRKRIRDRLFRAAALCYWLKKESPIGLLDDRVVAPVPGGPAPGDSGGSRNPFDRADPGAPSVSGGSVPPASLEQAVLAAEGWERDHEADAPGVMQRWHEAMARFMDRWSQETWIRAAERAGAARNSLKDLYRNLREADPDSLESPESPEVTRLLIVLGRELSSQDSALREKAARVLALVGAGEATVALGKAVRQEIEPQTRNAMIAALADLGGHRGAKELASLKSQKGFEKEGFDGLVRMSGRNALDRSIALRQIGGFAQSSDEATANRAVDHLIAAGPSGARGLEEALGCPVVTVRLRVMEALAATKDPRTARPLANFLVNNPESDGAKKSLEGARKAILSLGEPAVPHLFPALRNPRTRLVTGDLLREITGAQIGTGNVADWVEWWKKKHPDWKEE
jgi:hypothetical protein